MSRAEKKINIWKLPNVILRFDMQLASDTIAAIVDQ